VTAIQAEDDPDFRAVDPEVEWISRRATHVAKAIKGLLVALVAALALELTLDPGAAALGLAGTVVAVLAADVYEHAVQEEIQSGRRLDRREMARVFGHSAGIPLGAAPALFLFILAWLGIIATDLAIDGSLWSGIGALVVLGYASGRLRGDAYRPALVHGLLLAALGLGVLALKAAH
jgi:hypothetical protein